MNLSHISYLKNYLALFALIVFFPVIAQSLPLERDTIAFSYNDYYSYSQLNGEFRYSPSDSVSSLKLSAKTNATYYAESFKSNSDFNLHYIRKIDDYQAGLRFFGTFNNDKLVSLPASGNAQIIPEIGYTTADWQIVGGAGYAMRRDQKYPAEGYKVLLEGILGRNSQEIRQSNLSFAVERDNLDSTANYNVSSTGIYYDNWNEIYLTAEASTSLQSYHQNLLEGQTAVERKNYRLSSAVDYQINEQTGSRFTVSFDQKDKSAPGSISIGKNQSVNFGLSEQLYYTISNYAGAWRLSYNNNSENFVYSEKDDTYNSYYYQFNTENALFFNNITFSVDGRYYKYGLTGKSQNGQISSEDRDVVQAVLTPQISWQYGSVLKLYQTMPLEYFHLINISKNRSAGNHTDRTISSVSGWNYSFLTNWQNKGSLALKTTYQVYDFPPNISGVNSYVVKENYLADSLEWQANEKLSVSCSFRLNYNEFGYLNWQKFTEQPVSHSYGYLGIIGISMLATSNKKIKFEYIFFETDKYIHDKDDVKISRLSSVYIQQGPRLSGGYEYKKINAEIQSAYYFYRENRRELTFNFKLGYKI